MRPQSQRIVTRSRPKPYLQKKYKNMNEECQTLKHHVTLMDGRVPQKPKTTRHNYTECNQDEERFKNTATELSNKNFNHHHPDHCLCQ